MFVALSRGDSYPFTVRTDASGSFRADGLTPGAWSVAKHPRAIDPALMSASLGKSKAPRVFEPDCEVFDGQTTRFDIALHPSGEARLRGRLAFGGKPAAGWDARLSAVGAGSQARATKLDGDGAFAFAVEQAGNYRLELEGRFADDTVRCSARVELAAGDNAWVHDVPGGSIEGHVPARFAEEHVRVRWSLTADGGLQFQGTAFADAAGRFAFARVPAGRVHLVADAPDGSAPARDVELGVDATLQVDL
jgi:hypothetical protein